MHITKREGIPAWKAWLIRGAAILISLVLCAIIIWIVTKLNPVTVFKTMAEGTLATARRRWITVYRIVVLLGISLAVTPAFKMRFWNIGAEGQVLIGALASAACMFYAGKMPFFMDTSISLAVKDLVLIPCMLIASLAAGALWGFLPAFFKSRWNTNETLFTLMMNYVALQLVKFVISYRGKGVKYPWSQNGTVVGIFNSVEQEGGQLLGTYKVGWFPELGGTRYLLPLLVVGVLTVLIYVYLKYSKHGYEIAVVGESERTASYAGIKVNRIIVRTMVLSGMICGLIGFLIVGTDRTLTETLVDGRGYTAVMVSWMSQFNPIGMVFSSFLIVFMQYGAKEVASLPSLNLNHSFADILTGIILFFIIGCEFFISYKLQFGRHKKREG